MKSYGKIQIGEKNNRLTIIEDLGYKWLGKENKTYKRRVIKAQCECGNVIETQYSYFKNSHIKSCGCLNKENIKTVNITHGDSKTRLYQIWKGMKKRCENPRSNNFDNYGGRGISVCEEWQNYAAFKAWAMSNGYSDELSIDRIDNNKNYCPNNCRWATRSEQNQNQRRNLKPFKAISPDGKEYIAESKQKFSKEHDLVAQYISDCLRGKQQHHKGWSFYYL